MRALDNKYVKLNEPSFKDIYGVVRSAGGVVLSVNGFEIPPELDVDSLRSIASLYSGVGRRS